MSNIEINLSKNILIIKDSLSELRSGQISQLLFWNFKKNKAKNIYEFSSDDLGTIFIKILDYFKKEKIPYSLTPPCQEFLSILKQSKQNFEKIKTLGKKYKDGYFDKTDFNEFLNFIKKNIPRPLKDHQLKAAFHLFLVKNGANFSVPGSGKTAVVLSVYEKLKEKNEVNTLFVVGPASCFGPWKKEFKLTIGQEPIYKILAGGKKDFRKSEYFIPKEKKSELYLTTFHTFINDKNEIKRFFTQKGVKTFFVIDEAHYIKQIGGSWATSALDVSKYAQYRCVLTGTPLPRSYTDVFNLFDFLWPNDDPLNFSEKNRIQFEEKQGKQLLAKQILKEKIDPLFYRVKKSDLDLMPAQFHPPVLLTMNKYERMIYDAIERKIRSYSEDDYLKNIDLITHLRRGRMIRLRQCVSYIKLLLNSIQDYNENVVGPAKDLGKIIFEYDNMEIPAKLEYLKKIVHELQGKKQKVVIWSNFIGTLKLIVKHLREIGISCKLIYGQTPIEQITAKDEETREQIRNEFVNPHSGLNVLVANPAACAESISLHKTCYHAIYYDLSYNCAQYLQSLDRIHRVGGSESKQANYHFLQYENTIDQDIKTNLDRKANKMYEIIEEDCGIYSLDMFEDTDDEIEAYERIFGIKK